MRRLVPVPVAAALATALLGAALALWPAAASADANVNLCPPGEGAGQCSATGNHAGSSAGPRGLAVDDETGRLYVADLGNNRIDVFAAEGGEFLFAFGWGVRTGASEPQTCTTESGCRAGLAGSGAGQFAGPEWVAVDNAAGSATRHDVYVMSQEGGVRRVDHFGADGGFLAAFGWGVRNGLPELQACTTASGCRAGIRGGGECQLDGSPSSSRRGIAVGPGGNVFVSDTGGSNEYHLTARVEKFSPAGACLGEMTLGSDGEFLSTALAVDPGGDVWIRAVLGDISTNNGLYEFGFATPPVERCFAGQDYNVQGIAIDAAGHVFVASIERGYHTVSEYDSASDSCEPLRRFDYRPALQGVVGLAAFHSAAGDLFLSESKGASKTAPILRYAKIPPPGPIVPAAGVEADPVGNTKATIGLEVNPEGEETEVHAEYVDQADYEAEGFAGAATVSTEAVAVGAGVDLQSVSFPIGCPVATEEAIEAGECLNPETTYRFRVVATNADNPGGEGEGTVEGDPFTTRLPLEIQEAFASEVGTGAATLSAAVDPLGIPAKGHFEYVDDATYRESGFAHATEAPDVGGGEAPLDFGAGEGSVTRSVGLGPLDPGTTYHYRLIAADPLQQRTGAEKTLRTFAPQAPGGCANDALRSGPAALLPDCRAYEMVSPVDKEGGDIVVRGEATTGLPATVDQAASSGDRLAYGSYRAFGDASSAPNTSAYIASRDPEAGWRTHGISPPLGEPVYGGVVGDNEFRAFSDDLCEAWITRFFEPSLAAGSVPGYENLYRRSDQLCGGAPGFEALSTAAPPDVPANRYTIELQGHTADGRVTAFAATDSLSGSGAPPQPASCAPPYAVGACLAELYLKAPGGPPAFACLLPSGIGAAEGCEAGTGALLFGSHRTSSLTNALSAGGDRLYWTAASSGDGPIYLRENPLAPESAHRLGEARGTGDLTGPVVATGNLGFSLTRVRHVEPSRGGEFVVGQELSAPEGGIAAGTTITAIAEAEPGVFTLTLSTRATKTETGAELRGVASEVVSNAEAETGAFAPGQEIGAAGGALAPGTTIEAVEGDRLTLSTKPRSGGTGVALSSSSECTEPATGACTVAVSHDGEEASGSSKSHFWAAAGNGSRALYTTGGDLRSGGADLYEFEAGAGATRRIAGGVYGVVGASEDASRVYFASKEDLEAGPNSEGAEAEEGKPNLYLYEAGGAPAYAFVATLAQADVEWGGRGSPNTSLVAAEPVPHSARVSADGEHAAFISSAPLTGYDNTDARSGEADNEVFLYDAGPGELRCASCNPGGGRPGGRDVGGKFNPVWVAARLPAAENSLYASRVLSADGDRLFFEAADSLVPRDTNSRIDVYQWERAGSGAEGGCTSARATYSAASGGCISLISSGQSGRDSEFLDASPSGDDVFFATLSSLVPRDPGLVDIYDARVGGGFAEAAAAPACEGEACQPAAAAPTPRTPASAAFRGPGNTSEAAASPFARCASSARRAQRLARRAKKLRRAAKKQARRAKAMRRKARRYAKAARRRSGQAKRCRARIRKHRRSAR